MPLKKLLQTKQLTTAHIYYLRVQGSGAWVQGSWVLCPRSHQAESRLGLWSHLWFMVLWYSLRNSFSSLASSHRSCGCETGSPIFFLGCPHVLAHGPLTWQLTSLKPAESLSRLPQPFCVTQPNDCTPSFHKSCSHSGSRGLFSMCPLGGGSHSLSTTAQKSVFFTNSQPWCFWWLTASFCEHCFRPSVENIFTEEH